MQDVTNILERDIKEANSIKECPDDIACQLKNQFLELDIDDEEYNKLDKVYRNFTAENLWEQWSKFNSDFLLNAKFIAKLTKENDKMRIHMNYIFAKLKFNGS